MRNNKLLRLASTSVAFLLIAFGAARAQVQKTASKATSNLDLSLSKPESVGFSSERLERLQRRRSPAMTTSCSGSGRAVSAVPGSQRSRSMAPSSSSASTNRTVGSPSQKRSPWLSCSASMCGMPNLRTATVPSARHRRHPCAAPIFAFERLAETQRPTALQSLQAFG